MILKQPTIALLLCSFIVLVMALTGCNYTSDYLKELNYEAVKDKIESKDNFALYVGNKSCSHCKDFEPKLQDVIDNYKVTVYKIDTATMTVDQYAEFTDLIGKIATPRVLFFYNGTESGTANRIDGDVEQEKIIEKLKANDYIKD